mgnify:CR=1 FL=1
MLHGSVELHRAHCEGPLQKQLLRSVARVGCCEVATAIGHDRAPTLTHFLIFKRPSVIASDVYPASGYRLVRRQVGVKTHKRSHRLKQRAPNLRAKSK